MLFLQTDALSVFFAQFSRMLVEFEHAKRTMAGEDRDSSMRAAPKRR